jgi:hypothetical protein
MASAKPALMVDFLLIRLIKKKAPRPASAQAPTLPYSLATAAKKQIAARHEAEKGIFNRMETRIRGR